MTRNQGKELAWLHGNVKSPPFSLAARREAGWLLRLLQDGQSLSLPHSRPLPSIGARCHELRIVDENVSWRIIYRLDPDAVVIVDVFPKSTQQTPKLVIRSCRQRLRRYDAAGAAGE
jgi:phage-related protein